MPREAAPKNVALTVWYPSMKPISTPKNGQIAMTILLSDYNDDQNPTAGDKFEAHKEVYKYVERESLFYRLKSYARMFEGNVHVDDAFTHSEDGVVRTFALCSYDSNVPYCSYYFDIEDMNVKLGVNRTLLPLWQDIELRVTDLVDELRIQQKPLEAGDADDSNTSGQH